MADVTITGLPNASALSGTERVPMDQGGVTVDAAASAIAALATKATVGLGNADNTSDANKPISTATQTALDGKAAIGAIVYAITNTYTASGAISPTDRVAVINSASAVTMTLAAGPSDGHSMVIKRFGAGAVTVTAVFDGANFSIVADSATIKESVLLAWSSSLATWKIL